MDLERIGMASSGWHRLGTTTNFERQFLELEVYRESTTGRPATIRLDVPAALIAPPHLLYHPMTLELGPAFYEIVGPEIFRVGLNPGRVAKIREGGMFLADEVQKQFDYIVVGDAGTTAGLAAPFNEEETNEIIHLERLDEEGDLFEFWRTNANSDQMTGREPDPRLLS